MRKKLIELIQASGCVETWDYYADDFKMPNPIYELADHLIANGVIVPPVKVGQTVWVCNLRTGCVYRNTVVSIKSNGTGRHKNTITVEHHNKCGESSFRKFEWAQIGKTVFLTREDAEKALKGGAENA